MKRRFGYLALISISVISAFFVFKSRIPIEKPTSGPAEPTSAGVTLTPVALPSPDSTSTTASQIAMLSEPGSDSWNSEVTAKVVERHLKKLARQIEEGGDTIDSLDAFLSTDFQATRLIPDGLTTRLSSNEFTIQGSVDRLSPRKMNASELARAVDELRGPFSEAQRIRVNFKLFHIESQDGDYATQAFYEASGLGPSFALQQNATWRCLWRMEHGAIVLKQINVEDYTQVERPVGKMFDDCTAAVFAKNDSYSAQIARGVPYWSSRISREFMTQFGHHGIAIGDVNGDGLDDIYFCEAGGLPNRLYVQQLDGTVIDVSEESGVNLLEDSVSALLVDLDNDDDQDLVVATDPLIHVAKNDGHGRFDLQKGFYANTDSYSMTAADYDRDGDLDIYICGYNARKQDPVNRGLPFPLPYHDANNGGRNFLLQNDGGFRFSDVTHEVGLDEQNTRFSLAAAWDDFDNDGDLDLYVANDFGRNCLYRNDGQTFRNVAATAGVEDHASGMSVAWGDYDRDGWVDLYVSNMFSAAGNRITFQRRFSEGLADQTVSNLRRMSRGNTLFRNMRDGTFQDVSESANVTMGRWAWASRFSDLNNDGWLDLIVANGYVTNDQTSDL